MSSPRDIEPELPQRGRFSGVLFPPPREPLWFETDRETLRRVRHGLINLPDDES